MIDLLQLIVIVGAFLTSWLLTAYFRSYALRKGIMDIPNHRSSHTAPTPRGAGIGFVAIFLGITALTAVFSPTARNVSLALLWGGLLVAVIGWLDDKKGLPARLRLLVHLIAAVVGVWLLGGLPQVTLGFVQLPLGLAGSLFAILLVAWSINAYNFMDGIDGLAAGQAVLAAMVGGAILTLAGATQLGLLSLSLGAVSAGFLVWNFPPAKVFMGDVASGLLGYAFAILAVASERQGAMPMLSWILLLAVFYVDATATLLRRMLQGERWTEAHRSHAYQIAVQQGHSHKQVTLTVLVIGVGLSALVCGSQYQPLFVVPALLSSVVLLLVVWYRFAGTEGGKGAGKPTSLHR